MSPLFPPLLLLLLLLLQAEGGPRIEVSRWRPAVDGSEWLAAFDPAAGNGSTPGPPRAGADLCGDGASPCDELGLLRRERLEVVKQRVLSALGLDAPPPEGSRRPVNRQFLDQVIDEQRQEVIRRNRRELKPQTDTAQPRAVWTLAKQSPLASHGLLRDSPLAAETIYFDLARDLTPRALGSARLLLRPREQAGPLSFGQTYVNVYQVVPQGPSYQLDEFTTRTVRPRGWFASVDVTELVYEWLRRPGTNHGLVVRVRDRHGAGSSALFRGPAGQQKTPLLEVTIDEDEAKRRRWRRRAWPVRFCDPRGLEKDCCLYEQVVDFHQFGWDWVIAPPRYQANFCRGDCPAVTMQKYAHTHIAQQLGGNVGPCCSPQKVTPIWMLYWDNRNNIKWAELPGMRVKSCACH